MVSVGSVSVDIVPSAQGFREKVDAIVKDLTAQVRVTADTTEASTKVDGFVAKIKSIANGKTKVSVDTTEATAKITGLKSQLADLRSQRLSLSVDAASADAKLLVLRAEAKQLNSDLKLKPDVDTAQVTARLAEVKAEIAGIQTTRAQIRVDTSEVDLKAAAVRAELDAATRDRTAKINATDNGSSDSLKSKLQSIDTAAASAAAGTVGKMTLIAVAVGAIIPIAAAASVAVAGIGLGVGILALGALVGKLALGGVGTVAKGPQSTGSGGTSAAQRAEQIATAVNGQRQAEVGLAQAQAQATTAQQALTQARIDAVNNLQNLTDQVADNALAQRQAALDLATAQQNLATANANPDRLNPANATAYAQVQLAFDQAKQNQQDLADSGSQLSQQQQAANAAGVDGAQNVVAAQQQVIDSQNALVQAQFEVADSARQVALAHQSEASGVAAYQSALQKLDPVQQKFALFLQSIKPQLDGLKSAAADSFLPLLQQAIQDLLPLIGPLSKILSTAGTAFGDLAVDASKALTGPFWSQFLNFVNTNLGPAISTFGSIFGNLFQIAAGFFEQAYPLIKSFGDALAGATGDASTGVQGGALSGFFNFIQTNAPQLKSTLATVAGSLGSIFKSLAPLAGPALKAVSELASDIAAFVKIIAPVVKDLLPFAPAILAVVVAMRILVPVITVINLLVAADPFVLLAIGVIAVVAAFIYAYEHFQTFRDIVNDLFNNAIKPLIDYLVTVAVIEIKIFVDVWKLSWDAIKAVFDDVIKPMFDGIKTAINDVPGIFKAAKTDIVNAWHDIWDGLAGAATAAFDDVAGGIKTTINGVIDVINDAIKFINSDFIGPADDIAGLIGQKIPKIPTVPHLAAGGPVVAGHPYIVGDGGKPELFVPNQSGFVHPDAAQAINNGRQIKGGSITQNIYPPAALDTNALAMALNRRIQFA